MPYGDVAPVVETTAGRVRGVGEEGLAVFRGIPYAAAPVGEHRWRATEPHAGWTGVRDATEFGAISPQPGGMSFSRVLGSRSRSSSAMDEDCLFLNVWTPGVGNAQRPVLVWIHGGGNTTGAGSWDVYSCESFARNGDIVGVSINYRLGPFGHLYVREDGDARANFWLDDMLAALRWVQLNIAAFGGDPNNVTVAGQSGGAASIAWMVGLERARGLFRRAILQSPPVGEAGRSIEESERTTARYFGKLGVRNIHEARQLTADELLAPVGELTRETGDWGLFMPPFSRVVDNRTIHKQIVEALADGAGADIDILIGWTREEHSFFFADEEFLGATVKQAVKRAQLPFADAAEHAYSEYAKARPGARPVQILSDITTDERFRAGGLQIADVRAAQARPAYVFQFGLRSRACDGLLGAPHCFELPFVFNNWTAWADAGMAAGIGSSVRQALSNVMHKAWIEFVRTGNPNHDAMPTWAPYTTERQVIMSFDEIVEPMLDVGGHWRRAWQRFGGRQR